MRAEDALGVLVAGPGEELGGTHEAGEVAQQWFAVAAEWTQRMVTGGGPCRT